MLRKIPDFDIPLHPAMLAAARREHGFAKRLLRAFRELRSPALYGLQWGDPDVVPPLKFIKERYLLPYVSPDQTAVEIGPGGGRWTRYLCNFKIVYAVDYSQPMLDELKRNFGRCRNIRFVKNNGTDFPGIPERSIDYLFSFGTFTQFDFDLIDAYLVSMKSILKPGANIVITYSDKTKIMSQLLEGSSDNTPERMRGAVQAQGYRILEEDTTSLWASSVIRFTNPPGG
jgi:ubiquinone/menaquinone biosynthesis C-methylase UbiE